MNKSNKYSPEVRERAVRMVQEARKDYPSQWAAVESIAPKIGCAAVTLHEWVKKHEIDSGIRDGVPSAERERIKTLEREVKELRQANEILRLASAFFAQAELDRLKKKCGPSSTVTVSGLGSSRSASCCRSSHPPTGVMRHGNAIPRCIAPGLGGMSF